MYLSRIDLRYDDLPVSMLTKLGDSGAYALHQWLWQLFPEQQSRDFLFRQESIAGGVRCYLLSALEPAEHNLLRVVSKRFSPQLAAGDRLCFSLRVNPVVTRQGKRSDVLMDAKYHVAKDLEPEEIWQCQQQAAIDWFLRQAATKGFEVEAEQVAVSGYQQHCMSKPKSNASIRFSSVELQGVLTVIEPAAFSSALASGFGKSRGLGCGLMMIKRA